jgi:hypothetical protein
MIEKLAPRIEMLGNRLDYPEGFEMAFSSSTFTGRGIPMMTPP